MTTTGSLQFLIVGIARSGTTLVQRLASEIADVWVPPETHFWPTALRHDLGVRLGSVEARALLEDVCRAAKLDMSSDDVDGVLANAGEELRPFALFEALVAWLSPDRMVLGEKTPNHVTVAAPLMAVHPDLRLIVTVRDPRAVHLSLREVPWGGEDPVRNAWRWRQRYELVEDLQRVFGGRVFALRYEDVVQAPDRTRSRLADFLGVPDAVVPLEGPSGLHADWEGWKSRSGTAVDPTRADRWREVLTDRDAGLVWAVAGDVASRWGYAPSDAPVVDVAPDPATALTDARSLTAPLHVDPQFYR
jgi:hypothetical protein